MSLLTAAKAALEALETCDWNDNEFPDDTQYFDRFAVSEAATKLRAAIAEAEKQEPVAWIDGGDLRGVFNGNSVWVHAEDQGRMIPLYLPPAPTMSEGWQPIETAPKDGTPVLVYPPTWAKAIASIAKWNKDEYAKKPRPYWRRVDDYGKVTTSRDNPPTHWMPLPAAPKPEDKP